MQVCFAVFWGKISIALLNSLNFFGIIIVNGIGKNKIKLTKSMKRVFFISVIVCTFNIFNPVFSQAVAEVADKTTVAAETADNTETGKWQFGGRFQLSLNQSYSSNWVGSSDPFIGLSTLDNLSLSYRKNKVSWENSLDVDFGMRYTFPKNAKSKYEKTSDKVDFNSQLGLRAKGYWYYGALLQLTTQLANGRDPEHDSIKTSSFMTPGNITLSLGMNYKRKMWSWYISPVAAKLVTKIDPVFFEQETFGVLANKKYHLSIGAFTRISFDADVHPKVNLNTKLEVFYDYTGVYTQMRNTVTNFEMTWRFSVTEWLAITFKTSLLYDYNVRFPVYDENGNTIDGIDTDHLQFKELFGITLGYKFNIPKKK